MLEYLLRAVRVSVNNVCISPSRSISGSGDGLT